MDEPAILFLGWFLEVCRCRDGARRGWRLRTEFGVMMLGDYRVGPTLTSRNR